MTREQKKYNKEKNKAMELLFNHAELYTMIQAENFEAFMQAFYNPDVNIKVISNEENEHMMLIEDVEIMPIHKDFYELTSVGNPMPEVAEAVAGLVLSAMACAMKNQGYNIDPQTVEKLPVFDRLADSLLDLYDQKSNFNRLVGKVELIEVGDRKGYSIDVAGENFKVFPDENGEILVQEVSSNSARMRRWAEKHMPVFLAALIRGQISDVFKSITTMECSGDAEIMKFQFDGIDFLTISKEDLSKSLSRIDENGFKGDFHQFIKGRVLECELLDCIIKSARLPYVSVMDKAVADVLVCAIISRLEENICLEPDVVILNGSKEEITNVIPILINGQKFKASVVGEEVQLEEISDVVDGKRVVIDSAVSEWVWVHTEDIANILHALIKPSNK